MKTIEAIRFFEFFLRSIGRTSYKDKIASTVAACELALTALRDQEERENPKRLTIEELTAMDEPVWCACKTLEGTDGFWCLCKNGFIIAPSGGCFKAEEITHWELYRFPPKGE